MTFTLKPYPDDMMINQRHDSAPQHHHDNTGFVLPLSLRFSTMTLVLSLLLVSGFANSATVNRSKQQTKTDDITALQQWYQQTEQQRYQPLMPMVLVNFISLLQSSFATTGSNPMGLQPRSDHDTLTQQWQNSGWQWQFKTGQEFVRLQPTAPNMSGQGAFLLRQQDEAKPLPRGQIPLLIQAPHRFYDRHTGQIALRLSVEPNVQALAWNTVPRYQNREPRSLSDLAHQPHSVFALFAVQFALQNPAGRVIQLHGFSAEKRSTPDAQNSQLIVSNGTALASDSALKIAQCLSQHIQGVSVYGREVQELGGTQNSTGQQLRKLSFTGFVHLEMSVLLREQLLSNPTLAQQFARCLSA